MSSIRQLAGASTFGTPSLDMHDLDDDTSKGNRRRCRTTDGDSFALHRIASISGSLLGNHHLNIAGDIISLQTPGTPTSSGNSGGGFSTSFRRKKRSLSNPYAIGASSQSDESVSSPEKMSPRRSPQQSPQRGGGSLRLRASTWDTALKFSPLGVRKKKKAHSFDNDDAQILTPPIAIDTSNDENDDNELDVMFDKHDLFKLPSEYEMEMDDLSYSSHSGDDEEEAAAALAPTPKVNNLKKIDIPSSENLDQISNINPLFAKDQSSNELSLKTLSTFGADSQYGDEEEAKVEEGDVFDNEAKKERKQVSFADGYDNSISQQISYHADISYLDDSISNSVRRKNANSSQEDQRKSYMFMDKIINPCKCLSWSLVGSYIIRTAPCFWCMKKVGVSATDRQIVIRLNVLVVFFCLAQIASGLFLLSTALMGYKKSAEDAADTKAYNEADKDKPLVTQDLWSLTTFIYFLAGINIVLLIAAMLAQRAIRYVNLAKSVRYMWVLFWILPLQIFFSIGLFDYNQVMEVWTKHWWDDKSLSWYRELFCDPGTAQGKCMVPVLGGVNYDDERAWCEAYFNGATDCEEIRDEAQYEFVVANYVYFAVNGIWALILAVLMWVALNVLQAIITLPIVQRSKESNIPLWLTFPIIGSYMIGYVLLFSETAIDEVLEDIKWMGITYMVSGGSFTLLALVGLILKCYPVLNTRQKKVKQSMIILFIVLIILTIFAVAVVFATSLIYSLSIVDLPLTEYSKIACALDMDGSCTGCDSSYEELVCPEWSKDDVARVLQTITKQSATIAAIFLVYALATLKYGFVLFRHVSRYQIEYV
mmetsp:Transcript_22291/g.44897  ORF Transcript_22291/g.44897 Transcript_22291/m.44897 type:complete len:821 (-) Transcript_22291:1051-3513(-)|eukprot:CAMPEP_0113422392 /NCGR_PEP_ID=MMETSP0013_2-20120614/28437_1 /TAXON_ID=2843 ORGANISM="Skeletonema costatum, Strain 1716" /NCGR_SAMPLE_ID=MMETSP0013_2 /ASSEMBLY_ACC=CAM_ASM_000158 /LENGTH=820 /DNA_ID=CAMNT_0000310135 /DNA_START=13 /DNA_END=2475 /DNA_ORIENTATION=+ /assembly_acc=CAM_ASM_000158